MKPARFVMSLVCALTAAACGSGGGGTKAAATTYAVSYDGNGNTGGSVPVDAAAYEEGDSVVVLGNLGGLEKAGYSLTGWNTRSDGSGTGYGAGQTFAMGAANVTLYARWAANPTFTVTYDGNGSFGGTAPVEPGAFQEGQTVTVQGNTGNLVHTERAFAGWNTHADGSGTAYVAGDTFVMGAANVVLYARWKAAIAYLYDSVDSPPCTSIETVLADYLVTRIARNTTTVTSASLSGYQLVIVADQANPWEYDATLATGIVDAGKPIVAMGQGGEYLYLNETSVALPGLKYMGSGTGLTQLARTVADDAIWTTPHLLTGDPLTIFSTAQGWHAVTKAGWPASYPGGISMAKNPANGWHVLAKEGGRFFFWGLWGSPDDLNADGKALLANVVADMLAP